MVYLTYFLNGLHLVVLSGTQLASQTNQGFFQHPAKSQNSVVDSEAVRMVNHLSTSFRPPFCASCCRRAATVRKARHDESRILYDIIRFESPSDHQKLYLFHFIPSPISTATHFRTCDSTVAGSWHWSPTSTSAVEDQCRHQTHGNIL